MELKNKCEAIERREAERRAVDERKRKEEIDFLKPLAFDSWGEVLFAWFFLCKMPCGHHSGISSSTWNLSSRATTRSEEGVSFAWRCCQMYCRAPGSCLNLQVVTNACISSSQGRNRPSNHVSPELTVSLLRTQRSSSVRLGVFASAGCELLLSACIQHFGSVIVLG